MRKLIERLKGVNFKLLFFSIRYKRQVLVYTILFFLSSSLISWVLHLFFASIDSWDDNNFSKWEKSFTLGFSSTGFLALIVTLRIFQKSDMRLVRQTTLQIFEKFRDDRFLEVREKVWEIQKKWHADTKYKEALINAAYTLNQQSQSELGEEKELDNQVKKERNVKDNLKKDMNDIRRLFEFYTSLLDFADIPEVLISYRYFHYGWWRRFLYEIAFIEDKHNICNSELEKFEFFDYEKYVDETSHVNKLIKLDEIFGFTGIPYDFVFHREI